MFLLSVIVVVYQIIILYRNYIGITNAINYTIFYRGTKQFSTTKFDIICVLIIFFLWNNVILYYNLPNKSLIIIRLLLSHFREFF